MTTFNHIVLFGPQGSGKGTQGERLQEYLQFPLIVTGNIFRKNIKDKTELGELASKFINKGELVPDEITIKMISERLAQPDCASGFILDGFPRSAAQAEALNNIIDINLVLLFDISDKEAIQRITGRRTCLHCGLTFHVKHKISKKGDFCENCHSPLEQRKDDTEEALKKRLCIYHNETEPILRIYEDKKILHRINGEQSIDGVWEGVKKVLTKR